MITVLKPPPQLHTAVSVAAFELSRLSYPRLPVPVLRQQLRNAVVRAYLSGADWEEELLVAARRFVVNQSAVTIERIANWRTSHEIPNGGSSLRSCGTGLVLADDKVSTHKEKL